MTRLARWWRLLCWSVTSRIALVARMAHLEHEVATVRADYETELLALETQHDKEISVSRIECERWESLCADAERRVLEERRKGNDAWQEAGRQRRRADQLEADLAARVVAADA